MTKSLTFTALLIAAAAFQVRAEDWPQWGGPTRDHKSAETGLLQEWPDGGPKRLWVVENLGAGYAGPAIVNGRIYIMGSREKKEFLIALNEKDGKEIWAAEMSPMLENGPWGDGPRGTPTIHEGQIYAISGKGTLIAANANDGKVAWKKSLEELGGKLQTWGFTESPLVENGMVYCTPGGDKGAVAALDAKTGDLKWQSKDFVVDNTHYSSLIGADINGARQLLRLTEKKLAGLDAKTGKLLWQTDFPGKVAIIPTPIVKGNKIYVTGGYDSGCKLIEIDAQNNVKEIYQEKTMVNHHGGVVLIADHIYGFTERNRGNWICHEFATGKEVWAEKGIGKGAVTYADGRLYCISEGKGEVALVEPSPAAYKEHGRFTLQAQSEKRSQNGRIWTHPVIANGKLYLRDQEFFSCYDVSAGAKTASTQ
jgi:outer membrane protein assembly factor BamB